MSAYLKAEYEGQKYVIEATLLPDGSATFTFEPKLSGRKTATIGVPRAAVEDVIRAAVCCMDFDAKARKYTVSFDAADDDPEPPTSIDMQEDVILDLLADVIMTPCGHCGMLEFGDDAPDVDPGNKPAGDDDGGTGGKKNLLN